ncbi:MAG: hypothetical protein HKN47_00795 [Pirellulaceae bacterium]|nr:hypothetical protein [Pirellulaceae bacterium]
MRIQLAIRTATIAIVLGSFASSLWAQPKEFLPSKNLTLDDLVKAKMVVADGEPQVQVIVNAYRSQKTTMLEPESRIRLDTADGKTLLLKFDGPRRKELKSIVTAITPVGPKPVNIPLNEARFFRLDGQKVTANQASEMLTNQRPIFLMEESAGQPPVVPELLRQALATNGLILMTDRRVREIAVDHTLLDSAEEPDSIEPNPNTPNQDLKSTNKAF